MSIQPKTRRAAVLLVLLLVAVLVALAIASKPQRLPSITLKDGQVLELLGTTFGHNHKLKNPRVREIVHALAPNPLKKMLGPNFTASFSFGAEGLALWIMCFDPITRQYSAPNFKLIAIDEHGCEFESSGSGGTGDGYYGATIYNFSAFPRRQKTFLCRVIKDNNGSPEMIGELQVENPVPACETVWAPETVPVTKTNGPVAVRLNSYEPGAGPNLTILENGKLTPKWEMRDAQYEDSTGNRGQSLCRREAAWKYRGNLFQNHYGTFSSNEIWTLPKVTLPAPGTLAALTLTNAVSDAAVKVVYMGGPGSYVISNDVCTSAIPWSTGMSHSVSSSGMGGPGNRTKLHRIALDKPFLVVEHPHLGSEREMMLRVRKGDEVVATGRFSAGLNSRWFYELSSIIPDRSWETNSAIEVDVILQRGRSVEFLVAP